MRRFAAVLVGHAKAWSFTEQDTDPQLVIPVGGTVEVNGPDRTITVTCPPSRPSANYSLPIDIPPN